MRPQENQRLRLLRDIAWFRRNDVHEKLSLDRPSGSLSAAWFLGPKAENAPYFRELLLEALDAHVEARKTFAPNDPRGFELEQLKQDGLVTGQKRFEQRFREVLGMLRGSIPMSSYRNQSHMYWDTTIPSMLGYFATMLYNQNNCTPEASPVTTVLEMEVGDDLCRMLGFTIPTEEQEETGAIRPWGHITCDGSVANAESMWAARNVKYLPVALAAALREDQRMAPARHVSVRTLLHGRRRLADLDSWTLLNLPIDEAIGLPTAIAKASGLSPDVLKASMAERSVQDLGLLEFHRRYLPNTPPPATMAPATAHYSWPKAASLLGLGRGAVRSIRVDLDARTDPVALRQELETCLAEGRPVVQVVAVVGSTEESAVDPVREIVAIREEFRERGLEFSLHADAAWGGYFAAMLREPKAERMARELEAQGHDEEAAKLITSTYGVDDIEVTDLKSIGEAFSWRNRHFAPSVKMSDYVRRQYEALCHCDSITVDPHKSGFVVYPAGSLCYRNGAMRRTIAFASPVVDHGDVAASVGFYGIEGSKPGAAATAVYLSHSVIPTDWAGYGDLLGKCMYSSKRFYAALVTLPEEHDCFEVTPFQRLPVEKLGGTPSQIRRQRQVIKERIAATKSDIDLLTACDKDRELLELFRELGSDQCIIAYAFNFRTPDGLNRDQVLMNEMNELMFEAMSVQTFSDEVPDNELIVTASSFDPEVYGQHFVDHFGNRAGIAPVPGLGIKFLISTQQNPWLTATTEGDFTPKLMDALAVIAEDAAQTVCSRNGLTALPRRRRK